MTKGRRVVVAIAILILALAVIIFCYVFLVRAVEPKAKRATLLIPAGSTYEQALDSIYSHMNVRNRRTFEWIAGKKNYPSLIKPGKYVFNSSLTYTGLVNILRSGRQTPVKVTFNMVNTVNQLAGKVGGQIEADSLEIVSFLHDQSNYIKDGFRKENIISVFIPDTYQFYWNTPADGFYNRMLKEYKKFWTGERIAKARAKNLSPIDVSILASIIDDETSKSDEKPKIAGVYLNRLRRGMPLQACPTIKFALNDFTITRVLNKYLQIDSPYNTYKHKGLPPGPVGCPTVEGIEAVLNAEKHDYLFFAAKADFSGYHNFSRTLSEHNRYADEYQKELDKRKIFK